MLFDSRASSRRRSARWSAREPRIKGGRCARRIAARTRQCALERDPPCPFVRESVIVNGKPLVFETGRLAKQAHGAVLVTYGESVVLVTAVSGDERPGIDFFPLTCDYVEKTFAAGKIPGGFFKREGRQRDDEILTSRLIDRPCRPLFPEGFRNDTQVIATVLSSDKENPTDVLAMTAASAALHISDIPWAGPFAASASRASTGELIAYPDVRAAGEVRHRPRRRLLEGRDRDGRGRRRRGHARATSSTR